MLKQLRENVEKYTLEELKDLYKISEDKLLKELEKANISILYKRRTPYSNSLIPISDERFVKYANKELRDKINKEIMADTTGRNWPNCEIKDRESILNKSERQAGYLYNKLNDILDQIKQTHKSISYQRFMIDVLNKTKETKDWIGFHEEESYGTYDIIEQVQKSMMTDKMVIGYLQDKLPFGLYLQVKNSLEDNK